MAAKKTSIFNIIAPVYVLFYKKQKKHYSLVFERVCDHIDLKMYDTVLDVGCGTGALCSVFNEKKYLVTGIDPAEKMLYYAKKQPGNKKIRFIRANVLEQLPFCDREFDISIASYVAHGLRKDERKKMYAEMSRVSKSKVIIYDYNQNRTPIISMIEWLERGDYFGFIKDAKNEMANCVSEMKECFSEIKIVDVDRRASWYICTPIHF